MLFNDVRWVVPRDERSVPLDQLPEIMERFAEWREQYRDQGSLIYIEAFEFYAGGGELMIVDVPDR